MSGWDIHAYKWIEVWIDEGAPSLLMLACDRDDALRIYDPHTGKAVFVAKSYDDATSWLNKDDFTLVNGRMNTQEIWGAA